MKKNKIYILVASAALLALAGCAKDPGPGNGGEITVEASIGATKVSTVGDDSAFEANDRIAVYAWTGGATAVPDSRVVDGVVNTLGSDGKWTPATKMIWGSMTTPHFFLGISPVPAAISDFTAASFTLDPSPAAYVTSDLLVATNFGTGNAGVMASGGAVPLVFDHVMAKLNVNLKFRSEWDTTPSVSSVTVTAKTAATVNYLTKTASADATAAAGEVPLNELSTPATGYGRSYSSLQVPQAVRAFTATIDGKKYEYASTDDIVLTGGRYTTVNFIVGRDKIELGTVSVSDWKEGTTHPDVDALPPVKKHNGYEYVDMGEVDINGVKKHLYWATCNVGADNPWDYGGYYAWGETTTKAEYSGDTYSLGDGHTTFSKYIVSDYTTLQAEDDAASVIWGGDWRIPTDNEWKALRNETYYAWKWTYDYLADGSNYAGMVVIRKKVSDSDPCAGNSIFLPAAGYRSKELNSAGRFGDYWSSSLAIDLLGCAWSEIFGDNGMNSLDRSSRLFGQSIRPVFCERYPLAAADVATIDIGRVLAADGNIYADAAQATAAGTEARAVIAYVGNVPNYFDKFLAIALEDAGFSDSTWDAAMGAIDFHAINHAITIGGTPYNTIAIGDTYYDIVASDVNASSATRMTGTVKGWRMPSVTDWRYIFDGLGRQKAGLKLTAKDYFSSISYSSNATPTDPLGVLDLMYYYKDGDAVGASSLRAAINAACGNTALLSERYWSSSEYSDDSGFVWTYYFNAGGFPSHMKSNYCYTRAVFAY